MERKKDEYILPLGIIHKKRRRQRTILDEKEDIKKYLEDGEIGEEDSFVYILNTGPHPWGTYHQETLNSKQFSEEGKPLEIKVKRIKRISKAT